MNDKVRDYISAISGAMIFLGSAVCGLWHHTSIIGAVLCSSGVVFGLILLVSGVMHCIDDAADAFRKE